MKEQTPWTPGGILYHGGTGWMFCDGTFQNPLLGEEAVQVRSKDGDDWMVFLRKNESCPVPIRRDSALWYNSKEEAHTNALYNLQHIRRMLEITIRGTEKQIATYREKDGSS